MPKYSILLGKKVELSHKILDPRVEGEARHFVTDVWPRSIPDADFSEQAAVWLANEVMAHIDTFAKPRYVFQSTTTYTPNQCTFLEMLREEGFFELPSYWVHQHAY